MAAGPCGSSLRAAKYSRRPPSQARIHLSPPHPPSRRGRGLASRVAREADTGEQRDGHWHACLGVVGEGQGGMVGRGRWRERRKVHLDPEAWLLVSTRRENLRRSTVSLSVT